MTDTSQPAKTRAPVWGNLVAHADEDLIASAILFVTRVRLQGFYHAQQAVEKYLKALALSIIDPTHQMTGVARETWLKKAGHKLAPLARRCSSVNQYYALPETIAHLERFSEFDQAARYQFVVQKYGNGFSSAETSVLQDLVLHLRNDIPIVLDDYLLGMTVRGFFHHHPDRRSDTDPGNEANRLTHLAALKATFCDVEKMVRW
jgi:hypothetical protein